ncbi:MAG: hypothetical protein WCY11_14120, partial [Novosphingobium sp.]
VMDLSRLFVETRAIATALAADPAVQAEPSPVRRRVPVLMVWVLPENTFNDPGWPGTSPAARKAAAIQLLSGQGIVLATA